ncbi:MAG: hypothetical protein P8N27_09190 [Polaribacter sp.]|uniref:hypothetical protein n=1 Tax=Polaribacter sp. TaxID=1920175 RepID=UPI00262994DD|nr:hypothetical protein [Polaribacter sp.]MBT3742696.1 hypothetical protein [Polaribacter sp.]MDG1195676.1 hypothetical protein [Polaribacter sp.]MDG1402656.1 hypothetical protein [Polaribacter sp.]MDG2436862.1 hypothetical protein [Polaribacter sp.]
MKSLIKIVFTIFTLSSVLFFSSCEDSSNEIEKELSILEKVLLLESSEWLLKGFEHNTMHTFANGERFTYYGTDHIFFDEAIPGTVDYVIDGSLLTMDFHFGHVYTFEIKVSCDSNIIEFYRDGELNTTLYKRGSNYEECL